MLTSLRIRNFKSWRDTGTMALAPLTGLFGTNSSGKTSLLQFLLMLKQTAESADRNAVLEYGDANSLTDLGSFAELMHHNDVSQVLRWSVDWRPSEPLPVADTTVSNRLLVVAPTIGLDVEVDRAPEPPRGYDTLSVRAMTYRYGNYRFGVQRTAERKDTWAIQSNFEGLTPERASPRRPAIRAPHKFYGFPQFAQARFENAWYLSDFELSFETLQAGIHYLGPLRDRPRREYAMRGAAPSGIGSRGEYVVDAILAAGLTTAGDPRKRGALVVRVARWLKDLGLVDEFSIRPSGGVAGKYQVWVRRHEGAQEVLLTDVGFGVSQILPVIALCYWAPKGSVLIFEQPEIHLHPRVQAGLADVFVDAIRTRGVQIIVESHSEHLLRRLQRRIAEEKLPAQDARLYFCSIERGESHLTDLQLDPYGNITNWPEGFFGDEYAEIGAMQRAVRRRKLKDGQGR